ncbi:hypothetical protein GOQ27_13335 [Clostridium sp. D2Q-11]|uniref:Uncharacterized protein n=1 Tax=Anaeromonas frigoriresistens TaxID=2683708 RepID=A0A942Z9L6_9FIRM|nr:hypothetical protein [Anaeromonas frigoriresistens]MBS4539453.1 hypothetical protein [Anaeromonas frigoriresistens]
MKRFLVVRNYSEYEQAIKYSSKVETITVISGERERKTLIDVIRASDSKEEIEIESIENAFTSVEEIKEAINLALEKGMVIRTKDGLFSTEDVEDVPALGYLLSSIIDMTSRKQKLDKKYPAEFLEVVKKYMDKSISEVEALSELNVHRTQFYRLLKAFGASRKKIDR